MSGIYVMNNKLYLIWLPVFALAIASCATSTPMINVVCEENNVGNSVVKWETAPIIEGSVSVYASLNPNSQDRTMPVGKANIADQRMTIVIDNPMQRYYYTMVFSKEYNIKVATRNVNIPTIQNFRDLGGYPSYQNQKNTRWGMLYRSARLDHGEVDCTQQLKDMGIKTIIDLRMPDEINHDSKLNKEFKVINIPISNKKVDELLHQIERLEANTDSVYNKVALLNRDFITSHTRDIKKIFNVLLDKNIYPAIIESTYGTRRAGLISALILTALGVDSNTIEDDYLLSNMYLNIPSFVRSAYSLPPSAQEALTVLLSARPEFYRSSISEMYRQYGSVAQFLHKAVGLNEKEIKKLQEILLDK